MPGKLSPFPQTQVLAGATLLQTTGKQMCTGHRQLKSKPPTTVPGKST